MDYFNSWLPTFGTDKKVVYFSMEYAIEQSLKIYSGGLGFLAGSHLRSAHALGRDFIGIGILWKYGYYDQVRDEDQNMKVDFTKKEYSFLEDPGIKFQININNAAVWVKALCLPPHIFNTAPLYLLTTDLPENDYLARSIVERLYSSNEGARIAQSILLGIGGGKLVEILEFEADIYHLNEGHGLPIAFHLFDRYKNLEEVKKRLVFTTHTPEKAGNEERSFRLLLQMGFFNNASEEDVREISDMYFDSFNYTVAALRLSKISNAVSQIHGKVSNEMWGNHIGISPIISITNAQSKDYWMDKTLEEIFENNDDQKLLARKKEFKEELFEIVADQTGKLFDPEILTIVWARRFAGYKRADLILRDFNRFENLVNHATQPIQIIWAGKPYPEDYSAIQIFNEINRRTSSLKRCAVLTGYELKLSVLLKRGADVWLNNPRYPREASGTSGMSAAMNGTINFSVADGWIPEFAKHGENSFVIPVDNSQEYFWSQDEIDHQNIMTILEDEIIPTFYNKKEKWLAMMKKSMEDVVPKFDSDRMVKEYYEKLYNA